ncbi:phage virion morphogenesis protein [Desulfovibrio cuneatus]|uniref:phage virion morphogenesis protein n=1 Tax=Desulfovibrio cuneatus TaxID=159728 RepID=UPI0004133EC1|nr:phage virion morphogenesis protein [Desulfovibrio cuneatus]
MAITINMRSARLEAQLAALGGSIRDRQAHARRLGGYVLRASRKNVAGQKEISGAGFAPRKRTRQRQKKRLMLQTIAKRMAVISKASQGGGVAVSWRNAFEGDIARRHQHGEGKTYTAQYMRGLRGTPNYKAPCTLKQAKALIRAGYKHHARTAGPGSMPRRVTVRELQRKFTLGRAGLVLRMLRTGEAKGRQQWEDTPPARPFLGVTGEQADEFCTKLVQAITKAAVAGKK